MPKSSKADSLSITIPSGFVAVHFGQCCSYHKLQYIRSFHVFMYCRFPSFAIKDFPSASWKYFSLCILSTSSLGARLISCYFILLCILAILPVLILALSAHLSLIHSYFACLYLFLMFVLNILFSIPFLVFSPSFFNMSRI